MTGLGRPFSLLWFGEGVSLLGNATTTVLLPLLAVISFDAGPGWMGLLTAAAWLPWLVVGLPAGAWIDCLRPRSVMITSDLVAAALLLSVPLAQAGGVLTLTQLLFVAMGNGACSVFFRTAYVKLLPLVVDAADLGPANARLFGTESAMQVAGPGVAGGILQVVSAAFGLLLDAVTFVVSAICLWRIRIDARPVLPQESAKPTLRQQIREGVGFVRRDPYLRWFTVIGGLSNLGLTGYAALLVLFLVRDVGLSSGTVGLVLMVGAVGGLLGSFVAAPAVRRLGTGGASTWLFVCAGPPTLLLPLAARGWRVVLLPIGLILVGLFVVAGNVIRSAWRQRYVPHALIGRVVTTSSVVTYGTMPLAGVLAGWMGAHLGVRTTITVMALIHLLATGSILLSPLRPLSELPDPVPDPVPDPGRPDQLNLGPGRGARAAH